jgi:TIR domain/SIR2-like domain
MKERHWNSLVASIRHGQCILVLGPEIPVGAVGAPVGAGASSFAEALRGALATELEEDGKDDKRVTGTTLAAVAQQFEDAVGYGANALRALAERFYNSSDFVPSEVHTALAGLPFSLILTTCQDDLMAHALQAAGKTPTVQRYNFRGNTRDNRECPLPGSPQAPLVYHLFGNANEPDSLVLSENDLLDFLIAMASDRPPLPSGLVSTLKRGRQSFLFVGFGITQWYLRVLLKVLMRSLEFHRTGSNTIATEPLLGLSDVDREQTILFYQRGTPIELEDADVGAFLTELNDRLNAEGGVVAHSATIGPRPHVFISYAREDGDLAYRTFNALREADFEPWMDADGLSGGELWDARIREEINAADFTLVLYSPALCRKTDSYVNKEIYLARERGRNVRGGRFLIPLRTAEIPDEIAELSEYQQMSLRPSHFDEDMAVLISSMRRDQQRRQV